MSDRSPICASILHMLPQVLDQRDDVLALTYRRAGLDSPSDGGRCEFVTRAQVLTAFSVSGRFLGDDAFSLTCAQAADPARLGLIGRTLMSGATLRECLQNHARAVPSFMAGSDVKLVVQGEQAIWSHCLVGSDPDAARFLYEAVFFFVVRMIRSLVGSEWAPSLIEFPHRPPPKTQRIEEFFLAPVKFGVGKAAVIKFPAADLESRISKFQFEQPHDWTSSELARRKLDLFCVDDAVLVQSIQRIIDVMTATGKISLPAAARTLGMSVRSVQRRLSMLGTSFEELTDLRRRKRAIEMLENPALRIADVALALGYSDSAHFIRAFYRWHGLSPTKFKSRSL